jgi:energy-coupling factor transport system permease protein
LISIPSGRYIESDSKVHRADPRAKIVSILALAFSSLFLGSIGDFVLYGSFWVFLFALSGINIREYLKTIWGIRFLILLVIVFQILFTPGRIIVDLGPVRISNEGVTNAAILSGRVVLAVLFSITLSLTTSPLEIASAFEDILEKLKVKASKASQVGIAVSLTLTFIPLLSLQTEKIIMAQRARGVEFDRGNILKRARNALTVVIPVIVNALKRAQETAMALEVRYYTPGRARTRYRDFSWRAGETLLLSSVIAAICLMIFIL